MAGKNKGFHGVEFAKRYGSASGQWLNAFSAITRAEMLHEDAMDLRRTLEDATPEESRWAPWYPQEVISYYSVGYVTCLEWHARSRIRDLLTFMPNATTSKDITQIKESVVLEMLAADTTIAGIVAGTTLISSLDAYMGVFTRVYQAIGVNQTPYQIIKEIDRETGAPIMSGEDIKLLQELHPFRHNLVHEIGVTTLSHPNVRDTWTPDTAVAYGDLVARLMRTLEAKLTISAPWAFPNLLDERGIPVQRHRVLLDQVDSMEREVALMVSAFDPDNLELERWEKLAASSRSQIEAELQFVQTTGLLFYRYEDLRSPLKAALVQARHDYLKALLTLQQDVWGNPNDMQADPTVTPDSPATEN